MSDMIKGPMGPGENPEKLQFNTFEDQRQQQEQGDDEKYQKERMAARLVSLGIDVQRYSEEDLEKIVEVLRNEIQACKHPRDFLEAVLAKYGHDMKKRNLPQGAYTLVINAILGVVVLFNRTGSSARTAVEKILQKHQVAAKNPFGM